MDLISFLGAVRWRCGKLLPLFSACKSFQVEKRSAGDRGVSDFCDSLQIDEFSGIDFILADEFRVIPEVTQEPIEFPEGLRGAIETPGERLARELLRLDDGEAERELGLLAVVAVERANYANQKDPVGKGSAVSARLMES